MTCKPGFAIRGPHQPRPWWRTNPSGCSSFCRGGSERAAQNIGGKPGALRTGTFEPPVPSPALCLLLKMVTFSWLLEGVHFTALERGHIRGKLPPVWSWGQCSREKQDAKQGAARPLVGSWQCQWAEGAAGFLEKVSMGPLAGRGRGRCGTEGAEGQEGVGNMRACMQISAASAHKVLQTRISVSSTLTFT